MLCASLNCLSMKIVRINLVLKEELEKDGPKRHGDSQSKSTPTLSNYIPFILYTEQVKTIRDLSSKISVSFSEECIINLDGLFPEYGKLLPLDRQAYDIYITA